MIHGKKMLSQGLTFNYKIGLISVFYIFMAKNKKSLSEKFVNCQRI